MKTKIHRPNDPLTIEGAGLVRFDGFADESLLCQIGELRLSVWRASGTRIEVPAAIKSWRDTPQDSNGIHFALILGSELIAATRLNVYQNFVDMPGHDWFSSLKVKLATPFGMIGRLVVAPAYQHKGAGKWLDRECLREAALRGCKSVLCDVPSYRVESLTRMGFKAIQAPKKGVMLPEIEWTTMYLSLNDNKSI